MGVIWHTGIECRLELFVSCQSLLKKLDADVLHSTESMWKWSKREKVNAVDGFFIVAGKTDFSAAEYEALLQFHIGTSQHEAGGLLKCQQ